MHLLFSLDHTGAITQQRQMEGEQYLPKAVQDNTKNMLITMLTMEMKSEKMAVFKSE